MSTVAQVQLWGRTIGAVSLADDEPYAIFEYASEFQRSGIELAPLKMPLAPTRYRFADLPRGSFHGLPGLLADVLPDKFGNALIDAWLAGQGRTPESFNAVERLCYTGSRGMGALEFLPVAGPPLNRTEPLNIDALVELAGDVLADREKLVVDLSAGERSQAMQEILSVGTSAGGARAKAVIAWNPDTNEVRSGQVQAGPGFEYWLLKFDGVRENSDKELADPAGFGAIEYAYYRMALQAGLQMTSCRLLSDERGRRHFMTKRFDRSDSGEKLHMQSLAGLLHLDLEQGRTHSYEQAFLAMKHLKLPRASFEQLYRRMVFNIVARNQDDHVKNTAFLMDKSGRWALSPAFDVSYAYEPTGEWTSAHQMSANGKFDDFTRQDLVAVANVAGLRRGRADIVLEEVRQAVSSWPSFAEEAQVDPRRALAIGRAHRLHLSD